MFVCLDVHEFAWLAVCDVSVPECAARYLYPYLVVLVVHGMSFASPWESQERTAKWEEAVRQIHDLERRFSKTIEKESRTREDTQSNLLQLLEMTAQRVEVALRGNAVPTSAE